MSSQIDDIAYKKKRNAFWLVGALKRETISLLNIIRLNNLSCDIFFYLIPFQHRNALQKSQMRYHKLQKIIDWFYFLLLFFFFYLLLILHVSLVVSQIGFGAFVNLPIRWTLVVGMINSLGREVVFIHFAMNSLSIHECMMSL